MNSRPPQRTLFGHPLGLYVLFFTEMWERFSYYGMRALLILYMIDYFKWTQGQASNVYKIYTSAVYVTPILGGYLADRFLGNRLAVIIGATLMAIGHFLMAFEQYSIFYAALIFLILGNGFFKPNMSTQVGRLYPANDGRLDGAYTIFYMGINLGAFFSPLVCGWLAANTMGGFHSGFTMAGIGMVIGLVIYLLGQPAVREIAPHETADNAGAISTEQKEARHLPLSEEEAAHTPSVVGPIAQAIPAILLGLGALMALAAAGFGISKWLDVSNAVMLAIGGGCSALMGYVADKVTGGLRDRIVTILVLGIFVMFFWAAYEQAGNVLNVWADKHTNRYLTEPYKAPPVLPPVQNSESTKSGEAAPAETAGVWERFRHMFQLKPRNNEASEESWGKWLQDSVNPIPTAWFQSINALAIFVLAPLFAWLWLALDRRHLQPSIPMKMALGLVLMSASVAIMIQAANRENQVSRVHFPGKSLPAGIEVAPDGQLGTKDAEGRFVPYQASRLTYDRASGTLQLFGVLPDNQRDRIIEETAPESFKKTVQALAKASKTMESTSVEETLDTVPPGFDMRYADVSKAVVEYQPQTHKLIAHAALREKETRGLLLAAGAPAFRMSIEELFSASCQHSVSLWWLFWSYILATLGELCLSPVGLSMVSKLAPARFATMLMGVWLLTSAFGNFAAGALGEVWEFMTPVQFFLRTTLIVAGAAVVLFLLSRLVERMMHGVK